jgi:hypothetical protein
MSAKPMTVSAMITQLQKHDPSKILVVKDPTWGETFAVVDNGEPFKEDTVHLEEGGEDRELQVLELIIEEDIGFLLLKD